MTTPADEHRMIAGHFTELVNGVADGDWDSPSPVEGWAARDVVRHLVEWFPGFLESGAGVRLPSGPSVDDDPVGAWRVQSEAIQALLDDPDTADKMLSNPHIGEIPLDEAVNNFYTADVFMHSLGPRSSDRTGRDARPGQVRRAARRHGAVRGRHALERSVRPAGRGARRRRRADADAGLHRAPAMIAA